MLIKAQHWTFFWVSLIHSTRSHYFCSDTSMRSSHLHLNLKVRGHFGDLRLYGRIILIWILKKQPVRMQWFSWIGTCPLNKKLYTETFCETVIKLQCLYSTTEEKLERMHWKNELDKSQMKLWNIQDKERFRLRKTSGRREDCIL
jgi:hypothetical protein